jgi:hypothetical protein
MTTDASRFFTVPLGSLAGGAYNWRVKDPKYLATSGTVTLDGSPVVNAEMGLQRAGDANNDNVDNATDFAILRGAFGTCFGCPGYDDRVDFDGNQVINSTDFVLLKNNFGTAGSPPLGP